MLVDIDQPRTEALEDGRQFEVRRVALEGIGFEAAGEGFVVLALFVQRHGVPCADGRQFGRLVDPKPRQQLVHVRDDLPLTLGDDIASVDVGLDARG